MGVRAKPQKPCDPTSAVFTTSNKFVTVGRQRHERPARRAAGDFVRLAPVGVVGHERHVGERVGEARRPGEVRRVAEPLQRAIVRRAGCQQA